MSDSNSPEALKENRQRIIDANAKGRDIAVKEFAKAHGLVVDGDWSGIPMPQKVAPSPQLPVKPMSRGSSSGRSL